MIEASSTHHMLRIITHRRENHPRTSQKHRTVMLQQTRSFYRNKEGITLGINNIWKIRLDTMTVITPHALIIFSFLEVGLNMCGGPCDSCRQIHGNLCGHTNICMKKNSSCSRANFCCYNIQSPEWSHRATVQDHDYQDCKISRCPTRLHHLFFNSLFSGLL